MIPLQQVMKGQQAAARPSLMTFLTRLVSASVVCPTFCCWASFITKSSTSQLKSTVSDWVEELPNCCLPLSYSMKLSKRSIEGAYTAEVMLPLNFFTNRLISMKFSLLALLEEDLSASGWWASSCYLKFSRQERSQQGSIR